MPIPQIDPALQNKVLEIQGLFERYVRNAGANCDVLGSVGNLLGDVKLDIPEFGGEFETPEIFGKIKDGVSDVIRQVSESTKFLQDKVGEIGDLISEINLLEGTLPTEIFDEIALEIEELKTNLTDFSDDVAADLGPAIDAYFQLENSVAESLDMVRSINCPIVTDALEAVSPGITLYLSDLGEATRNKSTIRDAVLKKTAGSAVSEITQRTQQITSKYQGRLLEVQNTIGSINRIRQKLQGEF